MAGPRTNLALVLLLGGAVASGALSFALGTGWAAWPTVAHGVFGLGLLVVAYWKWRMVRHGLEVRPGRSTWPSVALGATVVVAFVTGLLHATGLLLTYGPLDDMQVHVGAALVSVPLAGWHLVARGDLPAHRDLNRRNLLRAGLLLGAAGALYGALEALVHTTRLPGRDRRATGSFEEASHDPDAMPGTIWLFDRVPEIPADDWELTVTAGRQVRRFAYDDIATHTDRVTAVLDCTSGWWSEQDWSGVALPRLMGDPPPDAASVLVRSRTGYARRFPIRDVPDLLLATRYEGRPLAARHGFPARLVAPGRRGFWWVKWVTHVEVSSVPWWRQSPYPLQ